MAIVNKFNVNKQEVTLDADIIENMSANDVSYNASTQYDDNTVGNKLDKLSELEGELHPIQEIDGYDVATITNHAINADGSLTSNENYRLLRIPNNNYTSLRGIASAYVGYLIVAFWNTDTPLVDSFISGTVAQISYADQTFNVDVPIGTQLIGVTYSLTPPATPSEVTLVKQHNRIDELERQIAEIPTQIQNTVTTAVVPYEKTKNDVDAMLEVTDEDVYESADFTEDGYYNANNTLRTSMYNYTSLPIIHVVEGQKYIGINGVPTRKLLQQSLYVVMIMTDCRIMAFRQG